jgi:hypothetical protein
LLDKTEKAIDTPGVFLNQVKEWNKLDMHVLSHIFCSPAIDLGIGEDHFMGDWGIFQVDCTKLSDGFQGNKMDLFD